MAATPLPDQQEQQPVAYPEEAASSTAWRNSGSIGPFLAVISVLAVLAVLSCGFGHLLARKMVDPLANIRRGNCLGWSKWRRRQSITDVEGGAKIAKEEGNLGAQDSNSL